MEYVGLPRAIGVQLARVPACPNQQHPRARLERGEDRIGALRGTLIGCVTPRGERHHVAITLAAPHLWSAATQHRPSWHAAPARANKCGPVKYVERCNALHATRLAPIELRVPRAASQALIRTGFREASADGF